MTHSHTAARPLRSLDLDAAARLLDVSPQTLLAWEARYRFPSSSRSDARYSESEVLALRDSLCEGASIAWAVTRARDKLKRRTIPAAALDVNRGRPRRRCIPPAGHEP